jgi:hypothetical protein
MAAEPAGSTVAGHYFLHGVTEVGSELLLKRDGKFEWALTYGNQDQQAKGDWHMAGADVVLVADSHNREPRFRVSGEEEAHFRRGAEPGVWVATVGVADVGPVSHVEVTFAAKSGKTAVAVSRQNGDAIVRMPATEEWARAGLRRKGSPEDFKWLDVPPQRAKARIASFDITNPEVIGAMPFHELTLHVANGELRVADPGNGLAQGMYIKQK